jgi:hypothetical protein
MIDDALATFLQQGLAINIGTRNARLEPHAAYIPAARVEPGGTHLTVFVPRLGADEVLADLADNGQAAVVFARPEDDRACQVKGAYESARPARDDERALIETQYAGFTRQLEAIGMPGESSRAWATWPCIAVRLAVTALFTQTPGPDAGAPLPR